MIEQGLNRSTVTAQKMLVVSLAQAAAGKDKRYTAASNMTLRRQTRRHGHAILPPVKTCSQVQVCGLTYEVWLLIHKLRNNSGIA